MIDDLVFIPSDINVSALDFEWQSMLAHCGPVEVVTPYMDATRNLTLCAHFTLASGVASWGIERLQSNRFSFGSSVFLEAALAFSIDPNAIKVELVRRDEIAGATRVIAAEMSIRRFMMVCLLSKRWANNVARPGAQISHMVHLVRHVLDPQLRQVFDAWLERMFLRLKHIALGPALLDAKQRKNLSFDELAYYKQQLWGVPLPPRVLFEDVDQQEISELVALKVAQIDWDRNPIVKYNPMVG